MSVATVGPAVVEAGCAQVEITPPVGVDLAGYFHRRVGGRVRDPLFTRAVVIGSEGTRVALVSCDLIAMDRQIADAAKAVVAKEVGIPADHVLIAATHTHTGPELRVDHVVAQAPAWAAELPSRIAAAVRQAAVSLFAATLRAGRCEVSGYSFNRLFRMKDGTELFGRRPGQSIGPAGPIDPELQTLGLVDQEGSLRALVVNFALHVDVIGGGTADFLSADWPGEMARNLAAVYGPGTVTVFLQGTAGDINHHPHDPTRLPTGGPAKAVQLGRALAGAAMVATERAEPMTAVPLRAAMEILAIPYYTRDEAFFAELAALKSQPNPGYFEQFTITRGESWPHDHQTASVPLQVMRLGEVGLVAMPAEIFARIGLELKAYAPASTLVVEQANADASIYVPTTDQAERGAYGARPILSRWLCADAGRRLADAAGVQLWRFWPER